ncbi:MAG: pyridine nucleotide-disulfide oxidoreductase [Woeseiaceae bacterium]
MLETALNIPHNSAAAPAGAKSSSLGKSRSALYGYSLLLVLLVAGWLSSGKELVDPDEGLGYWLGIVGGSLMLLLLLYPSGKKSTLLRRLGLVKHWFRIHMLMGLIGPLLILYHCNFSVGAMNSRVALYSMLGVAISGVIGRYFYTRIHRGLYGKRAGIEELRCEISDALQNNRGLAAILPESMKALQVVSEELLGDEFTRTISVRRSLAWSVKHHLVRARLFFRIRREVQVRSVVSDAVKVNAVKLRKTANAYVLQQVGLMRQVAQLSFYERLFSLWHLFHMPLFIVLVVSALVHVLAVHMY